MFANDVEVLVEKRENGQADSDTKSENTRDEYEVEGEIIDIEEEDPDDQPKD